MANITPVLSVAEYRRLTGAAATPKAQGRRKYGNRKTEDGFDSEKERRIYLGLQMQLQAADPAQRVVLIERQKRFELLPKQDGERAVHYVADFFIEYACGRREVIDVKSSVTRKIPSYVIKRKLMLERHGIRIQEM